MVTLRILHAAVMDTEPPALLRATPHDLATARALQRRHRAGALVRLAQGVYVDAAVWQRLVPQARHLLLARAIAPAVRQGAAFSHTTAALVLGWPVIDAPPERVHLVDPRTRRTEHRARVVRHAGLPVTESPPVVLAGVPVTSHLRTALDLATTSPPSVAAVAVDHAVRTGTLTVDAFLEALPVGPCRGSVRARTVAAALDPQHESVGESYTAVRMVELGVPRPIAQHTFRHPDGTLDRVDFWLPDLGVVVEFDGRQKYSDPTMLAGRSPAEAVWHEKIREDRLRSLPCVRTVVRPTWWHLVDPDRLSALFRQHRVAW